MKKWSFLPKSSTTQMSAKESIQKNYKELKQWRWLRERERQKSNVFRLAKQQLCTCITLFCTFCCRHCTTTTWNCLNSCFVKDRNTRQQLSFSFPELWYSLLEFNSRKICQHLMNWTSWNKCDKVWSSVNSLFKRRFHSRPCRCCLSSLILIAKVIRKNVNRMKCTQSHTSLFFFSYWFCFFNINYHQSCLLIVYNEVSPFAISNLLLLLLNYQNYNVSVSIFNKMLLFWSNLIKLLTELKMLALFLMSDRLLQFNN